jgi:hypothetical protein
VIAGAAQTLGAAAKASVVQRLVIVVLLQITVQDHNASSIIATPAIHSM